MKKDLVRVKYHNYLADLWYSDESHMYCGEFVETPFKATFQSDTMAHAFALFRKMAEEYEVKEIKEKLTVYKEQGKRSLTENVESEKKGK